MEVKKEITYINKDFGQFRKNLIDFTKQYFPNSYSDFNESSPGMLFMEMASYVGDVLSYYADNNLVSEFDCGVSPGTIVFDVRSTTSIHDYEMGQNTDNMLFDIFGRKLKTLDSQPKGIYIDSGKKVFRQ